MDANRSRVGLLQANDEPQQHALAGATAPQHRKVSPRVTVRLIPFKTFWLPKDLMQALDGDSRHACLLGFLLACICGLIDCVHSWLSACLMLRKKMMMTFTSTTSARITNSDDKTTELVAARPTPAAPPRVRIPWKHAISPMIRPNTAVLNVGGRKSLKSAPLKPALMN